MGATPRAIEDHFKLLRNEAYGEGNVLKETKEAEDAAAANEPAFTNIYNEAKKAVTAAPPLKVEPVLKRKRSTKPVRPTSPKPVRPASPIPIPKSRVYNNNDDMPRPEFPAPRLWEPFPSTGLWDDIDDAADREMQRRLGVQRDDDFDYPQELCHSDGEE